MHYKNITSCFIGKTTRSRSHFSAEQGVSKKEVQMQEARISKLAISSLIISLFFFIPIITGLLSLIFGVIALKAIKKSSNLLGKGLAITGVVFGLINIVVWSTVMFSDVVKVIKPNEKGVLIRGEQPTENLSLGLISLIHF